ncbi:MAG: class I SAM-dependent methyltransferase [Armatimonadota bacterium]|nr:class I SAM-dependent methyltransferase [Armatimonadota bacterium]
MTEGGHNPPRSDDGGERFRKGPLPDYYPAVAADVLRLCRPRDGGIWLDLGAGKGPVALALAERCQARIVLMDPDAEALAAACESVCAKGQMSRIGVLCGRAEELPLADRSVELVVSRGSIFFWDDQPGGLAEIYRVLREGGQAMIGGGLGRDYPLWARREFIRWRHEGVRSKGPEAYERFLRLRSPETFTQWAREAGLPRFEVVGEGGQPPDDPRAGLGIWLRFGR